MKFSIVTTIRHLLAPKHKLSISWLLWKQLLCKLRERGNHKTRESGAFLLSKLDSKKTHISDFILYDDLDPNSLNTGIIRFDGKCFGKLWEECRMRKSTVIADVHVHPGGVQQSHSDKEYPMIPKIGHIALIVPNFAYGVKGVDQIGIYKYLGEQKWESIPESERPKFLVIGV